MLTPDQLVRYAQIVDTALFKSYLIVRPGLLGPLCRVDNWCEVSEVEETLAAREVSYLTVFHGGPTRSWAVLEIHRTHIPLQCKKNACSGTRSLT